MGLMGRGGLFREPTFTDRPSLLFRQVASVQPHHLIEPLACAADVHGLALLNFDRVVAISGRNDE